MSVPTRRIGYYFMDFTELDTDERTFDKDLFKRLLVYINGLGGKDRVVVALPICHLKDFIACHRIDLYTVISIKKEKGSEHPPDQSCALNPIKNHVHYNRLCPFTQ